METNVKKKSTVTIIAIVIFGLQAFLTLGGIVNNIGYYFGYGEYLSLSLIIGELVGFTLVTVGLIAEDKQKLAVVGAGLIAAVVVFNFFMGFAWDRYSVYNYDYWYDGTYKFNLFCMMPALIEAVAYIGFALLLVVQCTEKLPKYKEDVKKMWFAPAVMLGSSLILGLLVSIIVDEWYGGYGLFSFGNLLTTAGMALAALSFTHPDGVKNEEEVVFAAEGEEAGAEEKEFSQVQQVGVSPEGYYGIAKHVVLLIFTFGIWNFIWIYKTTNFLNRVKGEAVRGATAQLLLCMFVPFYIIYWTYISAQRIDKMAAEKGVESDITVICLLFSIFFYILAPIFMQDKLNSIVTAGKKPATFTYTQRATESSEEEETPVAPEETAKPVNVDVSSAQKVAEELKIYKELLDSGIITEEDFVAKKKALLGL